MYKRLFYVLVLVLLIAMPVMGQQTSPDPGIGETVASFFDWYIDYLETNTYQMDDAYQSSPYLTDTLIEELGTEYASEPMADPVLCAQALPDFYTIEVSGDNTAGESATVLVRQYFSSPLTHNIEVDLLRVDGDWKLDDIRCQDTVTPRGVVDAFYTNWTNYSRIDTDTEDRSNPIVDRSGASRIWLQRIWYRRWTVWWIQTHHLDTTRYSVHRTFQPA